MICPVCGESLSEEQHVGITLDRCTACRGVWFDAGELESYRAAHPNRDQLIAEHWEPEPACKESLLCPRCSSPSLVGGTAFGLLAFQCESCRGVFVSSDIVNFLAQRPPSRIAEFAGEAAFEFLIQGVLAIFDF
jgi:Zn-finger nucleic acid-binding protein